MEGDAEQRAIAAPRRLLWMIGPGLLLAATGVGGGDLATGSIVGGLLGTAVLWAVVVGALLKYVVGEGLARWQLATGDTLLEGAVRHFGPLVLWLFLPYLLLWSFFVGSAQMSATGVTLHAAFPVFERAETGKIVFGIASGLVGIALVWRGGYRLFEQVMRVCIVVMFATVVTTAVLLWPGTEAVLRGLLVPGIPDLGGEGLRWTLALIGGIGGTLTVLSYGYWLREAGLTRPEQLGTCRLDLGTGYVMTALFGISMVIVGNSISVEGGGAQLLVNLAARLESELGVAGRWLFLLGAFGAVFSSLLGVWQAVPYLFADCWRLLEHRSGAIPQALVDTRSRPYRIYLLCLGLVPMLGLFMTFRQVQQIYTTVGALFFPVLALGLLVLNGRARFIGKRYRNGPLAVLALCATLGFFVWLGIRGVASQ
jgi:Mn2+/Fe2+ NRAMP family transporter